MATPQSVQAGDYVLYNLTEEKPFTFSSIDELVGYARNVLGCRGTKCDDFATKVYMVEFGSPFEFNGSEFIVWDEEWSGYTQYHASTKKSKSKPAPFSEMVKMQRGKNNDKSVKKEFIMDLDKYDDIGYMVEACANEMDSVFDAINTTPTADLEFKCSPDEYYQNLVEG